MNIFLVPHTWARHVSVALVIGGCTIVTWWLFLMAEVAVLPAIGLTWRQGFEGAFLLSFTAAVIAAASIFVETTLRRQPLWVQILAPMGAGFLALIGALMAYGFIQLIVGVLPMSKEMKELVTDPSFASLRFRFLQWGCAGFASGFGALAMRMAMHRKLWGHGIFDHLGGSVAAASLGGAVWHLLGYFGVTIPWRGGPVVLVAPDLYYAPAIGLFVWGMLFGLLVWGVPSELYAGWVRVLSAHRFGHRIPIDRIDGKGSERFVGHFPRGLDMFLPAEKGVAELHVSYVSDGQHNYAVRGLSQHPIVLKRFLESVDLRYDPRRPAPLETDLQMEDRVLLGPPGNQTEIEFILLPKEET